MAFKIRNLSAPVLDRISPLHGAHTILSSPLTRAIRHSVFATAVLVSNVAYAQQFASKPGDVTALDCSEATGSRIKRAERKTSQPAFTPTPGDIKAHGLTPLGDVIQNLAMQVSSINATYDNGDSGETRISLRNLGLNRTLVLINGKRWAGGTEALSSRVDLGGGILNAPPQQSTEPVVGGRIRAAIRTVPAISANPGALWISGYAKLQ